MKEQLEAIVQQMVEKGIRYDAASQDFEKKFIGRVLERSKGNQSRAARLLGMHRNTLSRTISELKLDIRAVRSGARRPPRSARPVTLEKKAVR